MSTRGAHTVMTGLIFVGLTAVVFLWWGGSPDYFPRWFQSWRFAFQESRVVPGKINICRAFRAGSGFVQFRAHRMDYEFMDAKRAAHAGHSFASGPCPPRQAAVRIEYLSNRPHISRIKDMRRVRWGHGLNSVLMAIVFLSGAVFLANLKNYFTRK